MTDSEIVRYYSNLLILQYREKPNARATVELCVDPIVMNQVKLAVQDAYNVDTAEGVQLDVLGKYAGLSRSALTFTGPIQLTDADYRFLIKMKIVQNNSGSSLYDIQSLLFTFFQNHILAFDYKNMHMSYFIDALYVSMTIAEVLIRQDLLPRPMAVGIDSVVYVPDFAHAYGFATYANPTPTTTGMNSYTDPIFKEPWLSYADALVF